MDKVFTVMPQPAETDDGSGTVEAEEETLFADDATAVTAARGERQPVGTPTLNSDGRPDPQWVRGRCPECGDDLVSNMYYIGGRGYLVAWECWASLGESPCCTYRRVL